MNTAMPSVLPSSAAGANGLRAGASEHRVLLSGIRWQTYLALLADLGDRHISLTYDRGDLEIMAPLFRHETFGRRLGRFVETLAEELEIDFINAGSTTFKRLDLDRGLEPDGCFYFQGLPAVLGKTEIDLARDPPPDLAIEIDITRSSLDRLAIYAALGVSEIWRFDGTTLEVYLLGPERQYRLSERSGIFPKVPLTEMVKLLHQGAALDDRALFKMFRTWVRDVVLPK